VAAPPDSPAPRTNLPPSIQFENLVGLASIPGDVQALFAARLPAAAVRQGDGPVAVPGPPPAEPSVPRGAATAAVVATAEPPATDAPAPAAPQLAGVTLPALDLAALEQGLRQFLGQLEKAGQELVGGGATGLGPWLAAVAAALAACEIARRQMQKSEVRRQTSEPFLISDF
jgi:hypothetical protein